MAKKRNLPGTAVQDPSAIDAIQYNNAAGSKKVSEVGRHLRPIPVTAANVTTYSTDATTARVIDPGLCLAVYNNAAAVGSVTLGSASGVLSLAPGVTNASGEVGIACAPNSWTYIACNDKTWVISSAATLLVYIIEDDTRIRSQ